MKKNYLFNAICSFSAVVLLLASCKKDASPTAARSATAKINSTDPKDSLVLTPGGWLPKSHVHLIEAGYHIDISTGHVLKVEDATGKTSADFGEIHSSFTSPQGQQQSPAIQNLSSFPNEPGNDGWVGSTLFESYYPITNSTANWTVPGNPQSLVNGPMIYIFNAISKSDGGASGDIMQPVLQWGTTGAGGGNYWSIASYYGWGGNEYFAYTTPIPVSTNTKLIGVINCTNPTTNGSYNYTVGFTGYANSVLNVTVGTHYTGSVGGVTGQPVTIPTIGPETWAFVALESYNSVNHNSGNGVVASTDYPAQSDVPVTSISLTTTGGSITPSWTTVPGDYATVGEHAYAVSASEVDLYFHPQAPIIYYNTPNVYTQYTAIGNLNPINGTTPATHYTISPTLPSGLSINPTTGVISGNPNVALAATNFTVTGTNSAGSGTCVVNITVNAVPTGPYIFAVTTEVAAPNSVTYFIITLNGQNFGGNGHGTSVQYQFDDVAETNGVLGSNSTVVFQITSGFMPTSATIYNAGAPNNGVISGNNITFTGVDVVSGGTAQVYFY